MIKHNLPNINNEERLILKQFSLFPFLPLASKYAKKWFELENPNILTDLVNKDLLIKEKIGKTIFYKYNVNFDYGKPNYEECSELVDMIGNDLYFEVTEIFTSRLNLLPIAEEIAKYFSAEKDRKIAFLLHNIAVLYHWKANYNEALKFYEKALDIRKKCFGKEYLDTATTYNGIAELFNDKGDYDKALEEYQKALEIRENVLGKEHPDTATTYNGIAEVYGNKGDYIKALKEYQKSLEIHKKTSCKEHPNAATTYNGIARIYYYNENYNRALKCCERALNIREKILDKEHPYIATVYSNKALIYDGKGNYDNALKYYKKALNIYIKTLGKDHPYTAITFHNIALYYEIKNDYYNAINNFSNAGARDALEILCCFEKNNRKEIIKRKDLVDALLKNDDFFANITSNSKKYKEPYILSIYITSLLHIDDDNEKEVAYYTKKNVAEKMFFKEENKKVTKFRLNSINYSNDPKEGTILLEYLFENKIEIDQFKNSYRAFAGCFTFNHDSLNQFRLYGKENDQECTGISIIFNNNFFEKNAKTATSKSQIQGCNNKHALFRCIYIDLDKKIVSVGHKEKDNEKITKLIDEVSAKLEELKKLVKDLEAEIIGKLLINLRYLIKHFAFKEEQECRILKIEDVVNNKDVKTSENKKQMYLEYMEIEQYAERIYFAPNTSDINIFQDRLLNEGKKIKCIKSKNPFTGVNYDVQI